MIFKKFLAASLLSSAHIALSESLPFSLSLFLSFILHRHHPASCFLHRASCMLMADHRSHSHRITSCMPAVWFSLLLFWFARPFPFLPFFSSTWNFPLLPPPSFSLPSLFPLLFFPPFVPSSQSRSCSDSCAQLLLLSLLSQLQ